MDYIDILSNTTSNGQHSDDNSKTNESVASSHSGSSRSNSNSNHNSKYNYNINKSQRKKRVRTIFTPEQLAVLEQEFSNQIYLVGDGRVLLAKMLNLSEAQVKVWFQNRRIKHRKDSFIKRAGGLVINNNQPSSTTFKEGVSVEPDFF